MNALCVVAHGVRRGYGLELKVVVSWPDMGAGDCTCSGPLEEQQVCVIVELRSSGGAGALFLGETSL